MLVKIVFKHFANCFENAKMYDLYFKNEDLVSIQFVFIDDINYDVNFFACVKNVGSSTYCNRTPKLHNSRTLEY